MPETTLTPDVEILPLVSSPPGVSPRRRLIAMTMVLSVSFTHFVVAGLYYLSQTENAVQRYHSQIGVFGALAAELISYSCSGSYCRSTDAVGPRLAGLLSGWI